MFSTNKILDKISLGETSGVEFKEVILKHSKIKLNNDNVSDEIAAFSNHQGGLIIFGIEDKANQIIGMDESAAKRIVERLSSICNDLMKPSSVDFYIDNIKVINKVGAGKNLVYIAINKSRWLHESKHGHFYRHGDSKRKMSTEYILRVGQSRSQIRIIRFDEQIVPNTNIKTLQKELYQRFIAYSEEDEKISLFKRHLLSKDNNATIAGMLMCSNDSDEYLYNSYIQAVYYNDKEKDANY